MEPYASILIPTHNRAGTLDCAVQAALEQSVPNIEVLVVGDGCTPEVRSVAQALTASDERVRFLDLPKAPFYGATNRNIAVHEARAARIFYSDDDDLLLRHHVETLGPELEDVDVVDTPALSAQEDLGVALGVLDSGHPVLRKMLANRDYTGVFDTHLAHRKSAYIRAGNPWSLVKQLDATRAMLAHLAGNPGISWRTIQRITAISFHGAPRTGMPDGERRRELQAWLARIDVAHFEREVRRSGSYVYRAVRLEQALVKSGEPDGTLNDLLDRHAASIGLSDRQRCAALAARLIIRGRRPNAQYAAAALDDLIGARTSMTANIVRDFTRVFSPSEVGEFLSHCRKRPVVDLAKFHLGVWARRLHQQDWDSVCSAYEALPHWTQFFFGTSMIQGLTRLGELQKAWDWSNRLIDKAPTQRASKSFWSLRKKLAFRLGLASEASEADRIMAGFTDAQ